MKVGMMVRTLDDRDGPGVANQNLIDKMMEIDRDTAYVLFYRTKKHLGRYQNYANVKEILVKAPNKFLWDQVAVPYHAQREQVDLLFHPKFTVPLFSPIPTVVMCRGLEYYTFPQFYERLDLMYVKTFIPLYYRKAIRVLTLSNDLQKQVHTHLKVPFSKMETVHSAAAELFYPRTDPAELANIRQKYNLPDKFIFTVTRPYMGNKPYPRKNIDGLIKAFLSISDQHPELKLVIAGNRSQCYQYVHTVFGQELADDPRLIYTGWLPQADMPYLYSLAQLLAFPSYSESFGLPLVEAMASGCPVVTSTGGSCPEIVGNAALLVEPPDIAGLAQAMNRILTEPDLRQSLANRGLERARDFSWKRSAEKVINVFKNTYAATRSQPQMSSV
jgi:glycosyltransferase involved in cell wall biosynthesis